MCHTCLCPVFVAHVASLLLQFANAHIRVDAFAYCCRDSSASTTAPDSLDLGDDFDPVNPDSFESLESLDSDSLGMEIVVGDCW